MLTEIRTRTYSRGDSCSSVLSNTSFKASDVRQRVYSRGDSCSSMSSNTTNTTLSGSLHSASTHSTSSFSDHDLTGNRKRVAIENEGLVENRKRFDCGKQAVEKKEARNASGEYSSFTSTSTSISSKEDCDSNEATRPRRRSHRPRGCRGGRKNRKKNQQQHQSQIPTEIGGSKPSHGNKKPSNVAQSSHPMTNVDMNQPAYGGQTMSETGPRAAPDSKVLRAVPVSKPRNDSPPSKAIVAAENLIDTPTTKNISYASNGIVNSAALTNVNSSSLSILNSRAKMPVRPKSKSSSPYLSKTSPPPFELTYSTSADSSSSNSESDSYPEVSIGTTPVADEILPPPPPPTSSSGHAMKMKGPNPYALSATSRSYIPRQVRDATQAAPATTSSLRACTQEFFPSGPAMARSMQPPQHSQQSASSKSQVYEQNHYVQSSLSRTNEPTTTMAAVKKTTFSFPQATISGMTSPRPLEDSCGGQAFQATSSCGDSCGGQAFQATSSCGGQVFQATSSSFGDSLFSISPRSFLTGAKSNSASFAW